MNSKIIGQPVTKTVELVVFQYRFNKSTDRRSDRCWPFAYERPLPLLVPYRAEGFNVAVALAGALAALGDRVYFVFRLIN